MKTLMLILLFVSVGCSKPKTVTAADGRLINLERVESYRKGENGRVVIYGMNREVVAIVVDQKEIEKLERYFD